MTFLFINSKAMAQVGIGTSTPNASSMLDVSSTTKGLLAPRMTTAQKNAIASPANGLLVYDSDLAKFNFYNGTAWITLNTDLNRDNYLLVKSAADLPAPSGGVITLDAGVLYEINGTIILSNPIDLNGSTVLGVDVNNDKLVYIGAGALFTGSTGGVVKVLTLASGTGANNLFSLNDGTKSLNIVIRDSFIGNFGSIGSISGFNMVLMKLVSYSGNSNGITYTNNNNLFILDQAWFSNNSGTFTKIVGTFEVISALGGICQSKVGDTSLDISGITSITKRATLNNVAFSGVGTRVFGNFSKEWEVDTAGLTTEKDDVATGSIYINTAFSTTITAINTPVKVNGITSSANLFRVDTNSQNNRLRYTGTKTRFFNVINTFSMLGANNKLMAFHIYKNGVRVPTIYVENKLLNAGDVGAATIMGTISLSTNDYVELWAENKSGTNDVTINAMNFIIY